MANSLFLLQAFPKEPAVGETQHDHKGTSASERSREPQASAMIIDSQSIKSAEGGEKIGFDGGKLIKGRKRNLITDTLGLVVLAKVTAANVQDVHAGKQTLMALKDKTELIIRLKKIFADGGYRGELVSWVMSELHADMEIVLKNSATKKAFKYYQNVGRLNAQMLGSLETVVWQETMSAWQKQANLLFMS